MCYHLAGIVHEVTSNVCNVLTTLIKTYGAKIDCREKSVNWQGISRKLRCLVAVGLLEECRGDESMGEEGRDQKRRKKGNDKARSGQSERSVLRLKCRRRLATISWRKDENNERWPYSMFVSVRRAAFKLLSFAEGSDAACTRCARTPIRQRVSAHACARVRAK